MTHVRRRTAACLIVGWLIACSSPGALAHSTSANEFNSLGSCAAMGNSVAEGVWQWCAKNEKNNMNGCKASFRSWVRDVERTCDQRRREFGCSPSDHDAVQWHIHGWKRPGQELSLHRAVQYCEDGTQGQARRSGAGDAPPGLDREARRRVQSALAAQGFDPGPPDGKFGPRTRGAIRAWQQANGHAGTGELTSGQVEQLLAAESPPGASAAAAAGGLHGSIAFSKLDGGGYAYGIAWNAQSGEAAGRGAREECERHGGGSGCREVGGFRNACGALAIGDNNGFGTGWGATNAEAESDALSNCRAANRNCRVEVSRCADADYRRSRPVARKPSGPICAELPGQYLGENHAECWEEFENQPGCHWWTRHYHSDRPARWTGRCQGGIAEGGGTLSISTGSEHSSYEGMGTFSGGKGNGRWTETWADGARYEGELRDGEWHGRGTFTFASGDRYEGAFRDGKAHGWGKVTTSSGETYSGEWRDGCVGGQDYASWMTLGADPSVCGFE